MGKLGLSWNWMAQRVSNWKKLNGKYWQRSHHKRKYLKVPRDFFRECPGFEFLLPWNQKGALIIPACPGVDLIWLSSYCLFRLLSYSSCICCDYAAWTTEGAKQVAGEAVWNAFRAYTLFSPFIIVTLVCITLHLVLCKAIFSAILVTLALFSSGRREKSVFHVGQLLRIFTSEHASNRPLYPLYLFYRNARVEKERKRCIFMRLWSMDSNLMRNAPSLALLTLTSTPSRVWTDLVNLTSLIPSASSLVSRPGANWERVQCKIWFINKERPVLSKPLFPSYLTTKMNRKYVFCC